MTSSIDARKLLYRTALAKAWELLPHEKVEISSVELVMKIISRERALRVPVLVEAKHGIILDGHHRFEAIRKMGASYVPVFIVDYDSEDISVFPRRKDVYVSKQEVVRRALRGELYPFKSTRHVLKGGIPCSIIYLEEIFEGSASLPIVSFQKRASSEEV